MADDNSSTRDNHNISVKNSTPVTSVLTRGNVDVSLAKYRNILSWSPKLSDFIIWHGWLYGRWYGVINAIRGNRLNIIREGLPVLLFTMDQDEYEKNIVVMSIDKIKNGRTGEYHILQDGIWYV